MRSFYLIGIICAKIWLKMKIRGDCAFIPLNKSNTQKRKFAMVDVADAPRVLAHKWFAHAGGRTWYARATNLIGIPAHHRGMAAFIMRSQKGQIVDHINGDGLDNRRCNLRFATAKENARNATKTYFHDVSSKFKGVSLSSSGKWFAQIKVDGSPILLGSYDHEEEAAIAYDKAAVLHFKEFAKTNLSMGLFEADKAAIGSGITPSSADHITVAAFLGQEQKDRWQSFLEDEEPDIDRSIPHRDRRRSKEALARRAAKMLIV